MRQLNHGTLNPICHLLRVCKKMRRYALDRLVLSRVLFLGMSDRIFSLFSVVVC